MLFVKIAAKNTDKTTKILKKLGGIGPTAQGSLAESGTRLETKAEENLAQLRIKIVFTATDQQKSGTT